MDGGHGEFRPDGGKMGAVRINHYGAVYGLKPLVFFSGLKIEELSLLKRKRFLLRDGTVICVSPSG